MKVGPNQRCPCGSGTKFKRCCRAIHQGAAPEAPEALMRARYSAYATGNVEFILATTDPQGPHFEADAAAWRQSVARFCSETEFLALEVIESSSTDTKGVVAFRVQLTQSGQDASFGERSSFVRSGEGWLYHSGTAI
jgi:SEC-C motif domain protein